MALPTKNDLFSGFLVFLIALPLCMGIAMASGFPAIAGIISAIIGGCLATFMGSSRLTIKGPAAGLIVIAISCVTELGMGDTTLGYKRCLAVGVIAAILQISFATFKWGRFAEIMPPSVIHGMLAAIGVIIISKQSHILLGVVPTGKTPLQLLSEIPHSFKMMNPEVFLLGMITVGILFLLPFLKSTALIRKVPAPLLAIFATVPISIFFDFDHVHHYKLFGYVYDVGPNFLIALPGNILSALVFPDFSMIMSWVSLKYILMFALVGSIESLLTVSAVDSLDPKEEVSDLNKDLFATGCCNLLASLVGGLPVISEIVRSKANIDNGAKTRWSNFFHGFFLLLFASVFPSILHLIPLSTLAGILVYVGYRLSSPGEFIHTYHMGKDQFLLFTATFTATIFTDLLVGVGVGMLLKLLIHLKRGASFSGIFGSQITSKKMKKFNIIDVKGPSVFTNYLALKKEIEQYRNDKNPIHVNFSKCRLIDLTTQTKMQALQRDFGAEKLIISGLENHNSHSPHPFATKQKTI